MFFAWKYKEEVRRKFEALFKSCSKEGGLASDLDTEMVVLLQDFKDKDNCRKRKSSDNHHHSTIIKLTKTESDVEGGENKK
jgi:hypothetical protein